MFGLWLSVNFVFPLLAVYKKLKTTADLAYRLWQVFP